MLFSQEGMLHDSRFQFTLEMFNIFKSNINSVHNFASWFCSLVLSFPKKEPAGKFLVYGSLTGHS
jgi:hypothetical protein